MKDSRTVMVKFVKGIELSESTRSIKRWLGSDLVDSSPLFEDENLEELSTIFELRIDVAVTDLNEIAEKLESQEEVEYAHVPEERVPSRDINICDP